jgi:hypothetical protein
MGTYQWRRLHFRCGFWDIGCPSSVYMRVCVYIIVLVDSVSTRRPNVVRTRIASINPRRSVACPPANQLALRQAGILHLLESTVIGLTWSSID